MTVTTGPRVELEFDARLERRETVADGVLRLTFTRVGGGAFDPWEPGAHVDLVLGPDLVRQYSLCGDPAERDVLRVAVLDVPDGRGGSRFVHERLDEGSTVRLRGPRNTFPFLPARRYVFVAGGIGITPLLPMVRAAHAAGADWRLLYGGRTRTAMAFGADLARDHGDRVALAPQDEVGLLDLDALPADPGDDALVYCCGPEPLIAAVEERAAGWPRGTLRVERFAPREAASGGGAFDVELAETGVTVHVPEDRSVLEAVEDSGVQVLSSCREGTCGTCETPVLDGVPDHRDSLLTDEERASGEMMMICVSRARTPRLVLEL
ncbi:PDR/VanB family oxidoreductase [Nocardiopsis sp. NRRL B-16309]|uniref:PDR/VanB family oxidoreductase n=1 Tax=Nocardiopsis sp. NRRL B-16309 TaxID=1519494 RepID=UPI0006AEC2BC|nr:PDR/VanB family oxidoreductase [Nocardiopsis sp. NRRL B-16309]KOX22288.1 ferredoxin [Nocardiopsis sp. NRRL B-16309]